MHRTFSIFILLILSQMLGAQTNQWVKIPWKAEVTSTSDQSVVPFHIDNAIYESKYEGFPLYQSSISNVASNVEITLGAVKYKLADKQIAGFENVIPNTLKFEAKLVISHGKEQWQIFVLPFLQINGQLNLVESLELVVRPIPDIPIASRSRAFKDKSQFASGTYYKLSIPKYGVYKIDYNYFKNTLKINPEQIDPRNIKLWGTGGGRLPERSSDPRVDDVDQIAIKVVGEEDGKFNEGDYVLFYGTGPDRVKFVDGPKPYFLQTKNIYDDESNYFLQVADDKGLRITQKTAESQFEMVSTGFDDFIAYEEDQVNLLGSYVSSQGGGKEWYGDYFDLNKTFDYTSKFKFDHIRTEDSARVDFKFVARFDSDFASVAPVNLKVENSNFSTQLKGTNLSNNEATYAFANTISQRFKASNDNLSVVVNFPSVPGSAEQKGWLDYIQINARRNLILDKAWQTFRDLQAISKSSTQFNFQTDGKFYEIWDVSAPLVPQLQPVNTSSNALTFNTLTGGLREFLAFQTTGEFTAPSYIGTIDNQNLHQITKADMIVLYHPDFKEAAERITLYRQQHNGFEVHAVSVLDIYNEFSGGTVDPVAIRDFFRMVYSRDPNLSYALLLGDGTYDYRNISKNLAYENFIPVYETDESRDPINTFPTDDFFTQLDPNEGGSLVSDGLDIAIGRMPARTAKEALGMVDKIIHYESSPFCHGSWRLDQSLVADDNTVGYYEDFFDQTEDIANPLALKFPFLNVNRIQFDAYKEEYTPGGERHPAVKSTINAEMYKGLLVINYLGHGGPNGWAQERVLELSDIQSWDNYDHLPLMITATCSFAGYDDPSVNSAGELAIRRPDGGVAALFTTVRAVYAFQNFTLTDNVFKNLFVLENGHYISVGETLRRAKKLSTNDRKFMLLGDPAMKLAVPEWKVDITEINGKAVDQNFADTARALSIVTVKGKISDGLGNARPDFNGTLYPTVFDKPTALQTLGQGPQNIPIKTFEVQKSVIFKGESTIKDGQFEFSFVVPKDIDYDFGHGKISLYATDGIDRDAAGSYDSLVIGGAEENSTDDTPPIVGVYINSFHFRSGGITAPKPTLLLDLRDDSGINVSGTSIGHDLTATIDGDENSKIVLNDFFRAALDDHTRGTVEYPLNIEKPGTYTIHVKAWDSANNSAVGTTTFKIIIEDRPIITDLTTYPNPFTQSTCISFEHNLNQIQAMAEVTIFDQLGRKVKTLRQELLGGSSSEPCILWDGTGDDGNQLAHGIYVYRVSIVLPADSGFASPKNRDAKFGKVVLLK